VRDTERQADRARSAAARLFQTELADGVSAFPKSSFVQCDPKSIWKYAILEDRLSDSVELRPITSHIN
jgi:hypothetical protein